MKQRRRGRARETGCGISSALRSCWLVAGLVATIVGGDVFGAESSDARSKSGPGAYVITPMPGICDTSNIADVFPDLSEPRTKRDQIAFLQGRIVECSREIRAALSHAPAPTPTPYWIPAVPYPTPSATPSPVCLRPPAATLESNRFALYARLGKCFAYWTYLSTLPTPGATESPPPSIAARPTFYVFATGAADTTAAAVLIRALVDRLTQVRRKAVRVRPPQVEPDANDDVRVVGRADWTATSDFTSQCRLDPNTRGALIIQTSIPETYRHNYLLIVANFSNVSASVEMLGCGTEDHNSATSPLSLWSQQGITGKAHEDAWTLGTLASLATFLTLSRTTTTVARTQEATTVTHTDSAAPVFTGTVLSFFQGENLNVPAQNPSVGLRVAGGRFADAALERLAAFCNEPEIARLAADGDPTTVPPPPPQHRTLLYKAASEYVANCALFANFER
ncbi:MAG: hypothetical protein M3R53_04990 [Candidatus Eremiobacteraeota bacterium]|nr:hypothetical protein [Candidatus Eremiobacteraeota bacterium]